MIEPSDVDLNSCPETVQNYVKHLEAEASEKFCICPLMSKAYVERIDGREKEDLIRIYCQGKDCALWVVAGFTDEGKTIEHCGLIK